MWNDDGWSKKFRLGVVTPHADICPEVEIQAMAKGLPLTFHGARIDFSPMHPGGLIDEKIAHGPVARFVNPDVVDPVVHSLSSSPLDFIVLAFTSSSFKLGAVGERELIIRLRDQSHGIPLVTTGVAAVEAIRDLSAEKLAVMAPSWFDSELCELGYNYFSDNGIDVVSVTPSGPIGGPLAITPKATAEAAEKVLNQTGADSLYIAGNGHRAIGAIEYIERSFGIPVITANQVLLWAALQFSGMPYSVEGYGQLLSQRGSEVTA